MREKETTREGREKRVETVENRTLKEQIVGRGDGGLRPASDAIDARRDHESTHAANSDKADGHACMAENPMNRQTYHGSRETERPHHRSCVF